MSVVYWLAVLAIAVGAKLLLVSVGFIVLVGVGEWLTHLSWKRLPVSRCADLTNPLARRMRRTAIRGTAAGNVIAPLSKQPCAWYRVRVVQTIEHHEYPDTHADLWTHQSDDTLGIQDVSGTVRLPTELIFRELLELGRAKSVTKFPWDGTQRSGIARLEALGLIPAGAYSQPRRSDIWVQETIVPLRRPITAVGVPRRRGNAVVLTKPRLGLAGVSTLSIEELRQRAAKESSETWSLSRGLGLIGITLSAFGWIAYFVITDLHLN